MYKTNLAIAAGLLVVASAVPADASGFLLMNHGARSSGRANAFAATADDGSAIFHNPAGITQVAGLQLYLGMNAIGPSSQFSPADGSDSVSTNTGVAATPHGYFTAQLTDTVTAGIGVNPPYGLGIEWPEESPGRDIAREQVLRSWFITPTVAVDMKKLGVPGLSLAVGLDLAPASAYLRRDVLFGDQVGQLELSGRDFGIGGRIGVLYRPTQHPQVSIGAMYRLPIKYNFDGQADFDIDDPALRGSLPPDGDGSVSLEVPGALNVGVAYRVRPNLQAEVDVNYVDWSVYKELVVALPGDTMLASEKNWQSKVAVRVGVEYDQKPWSLRAGYVYDPTPVPDETLDFTLPDVDRNIVTAGFGIDLPRRAHLDIAAWYLIPASRDTSMEPFEPREKGTFEVTAWLLSAGLSVGF